jgi:hypothetical protein
MKRTLGFTPFRPHSIICPFCEAHKPCLAGESQVCCDLCARVVEGAVLWAAGACPAWRPGQHECESSHTEMRGMLDAKVHCPHLRLGGGRARS